MVVIPLPNQVVGPALEADRIGSGIEIPDHVRSVRENIAGMIRHELESVRAATAIQVIIATAAVDDIVAGASIQPILARATVKVVCTTAAIDDVFTAQAT